MVNGYYWVRISSFHKGQWTIAIRRDGGWFHSGKSVEVVEVGPSVSGPAL